MESDDDLSNFIRAEKQLSGDKRPLRMRVAHPEGISDDVLLPQRISGTEAICEGFSYNALCVSTNPRLPPREFIALPVELQIVTDRGELRSICGIVTQACAGESDGGLATYQLLIQDAMQIMERRTNSRIFRKKNELEIIQILLTEWCESNPVLAAAFEFEFDQALLLGKFPRRESTMQYNESDAAFIRRLLKRRGVAWYFRPGRARASVVKAGSAKADIPAHTLCMFDDAKRLPQNPALTMHYHRDNAVEERDSISAWSAVHTLQAGSVTRHSWDYGNPRGTLFMTTDATGTANQGVRGNQLAASLNDYFIEAPHVADDNEDHCKLGQLRMAHHEYMAKCYHGEGNMGDLCVGQWLAFSGHPEIDARPLEQRNFVVTALHMSTENNLPQDIAARVDRLFARNRWDGGTLQAAGGLEPDDGARYRNAFTCVERGVAIVPAFDPRVDVPQAQMQSAIVVGPKDEEVYCDKQGRVKIRLVGMRDLDHRHAHGAGASDSEADSAWVRVLSGWAGDGPGSGHQCGLMGLPRVNTEVAIIYMGGDPDKPVIVGQLYNRNAQPPALSARGDLPGNRYLAGMRSREIHGARGNQLCLDDTQGQISAQLASDHQRSALNLGWLTRPRSEGEGAPRGEGAELHSDGHLALQAGKGMLLSAWARLDGDKQMARGEYLALMEECVQLFRSLGQYAGAHQAMPIDDKAHGELHSAVKQWENGSNTQPKGVDGGAPAIAITAPAGISFATSKAIVSYAAANIDTVAQLHLQMTAGQRYNLNAGQGISLFSHHNGITAIAHYGKFLLQSQHDDTEINAAKNIKLTATEGKVMAMADEIIFIAKDGSFIKLGDGITLGSKSPIKYHAPNFVFSAPETMAANLPTFDTAGTDQQFSVRFEDGVAGDADVPAAQASVAPKHALDIALSDGSTAKGVSCGEGKSDVFKRDAMHLVDVTVWRGGEDK